MQDDSCSGSGSSLTRKRPIQQSSFKLHFVHHFPFSRQAAGTFTYVLLCVWCGPHNLQGVALVQCAIPWRDEKLGFEVQHVRVDLIPQLWSLETKFKDGKSGSTDHENRKVARGCDVQVLLYSSKTYMKSHEEDLFHSPEAFTKNSQNCFLRFVCWRVLSDFPSLEANSWGLWRTVVVYEALNCVDLWK